MGRYVAFIALLVTGGCFSFPLPDGGKGTALVPNNPFGVEAPPAAPTKASYAPADQKIAEQVYKVGRDLLVANPQVTLRPLFATIGVEPLEVFHVDTGLVYVTQGLVKRCRSDADLAAILAVELGKMVAEREAHTSRDVRSPEKLPPIQMPAGNSSAGRDSDFTAVAELGRFENSNPRTPPRALPLPDPTKLARGYLEKAGYQASALDSVSPLLEAAEKNIALERHIKGTIPQSPWSP